MFQCRLFREYYPSITRRH
nr:unnamed protein product [Callosobruchus analis]